MTNHHVENESVDSNPNSNSNGDPNLSLERPPARATRSSAVHRWLCRALLAVLLLAFLGVAVVASIFYAYSLDLPNIDKLGDYDPPQVTNVFDQNGVQVAEFFRERRTLVPIAEIPAVMRQAIVAAEDGNFYEHSGLDYIGILRAIFIDLKELRLVQGASTITQQVVKNMVLSPERRLARKIKEAILARRLEQNLTKDELLSLYLNHIYFGHGRYGIGEAARFYFDKAPKELTLGEAAVLAGLPQGPSRLSPLRNPMRAKKRQRYVLEQMARNGFITQEEAELEMARPIAAVGREVAPVGKYYVEAVRRLLLTRYGQKTLLEGGLRVEIAMDAHAQRLAEQAIAHGLEALERRRGFAVPTTCLDAQSWSALRQAFVELTAPKPAPTSLPPPSRPADGVADADGDGDADDEIAPPKIGWDFSGLPIAQLQQLLVRAEVDTHAAPPPIDSEVAVDARAIAGKLTRRSLVPGTTLLAPLHSADERGLRIDLGNAIGRVDRSTLAWAKLGPSAALLPGGLYRVRVREAHPKLPKKAAPLSEAEAAAIPLDLVPMPSVQAALVAIDPISRRVLAIGGGYDFATSQFNRATQARRQPGSSFKPIVYGAALESGRFTLASILNDAPDIHRDRWTGKEWRPQNFERDVYEGPMGLREALSKSKNTISVRLIEAVGPEAVIDFARRMGISSPLPSNLTLGLGTGEVTPLELANAYATIAAKGQSAEPTFLLNVWDKRGQLLEQASPASEEVVSPAVAFLVTSLMQSVVEEGTGRRAGELGRPVAGKTGTASQNRDAWFAGFTPDIVAVVWVGRDNHEPIGRAGTGGGVALPIWLDFMKGAIEGTEARDFEPPEDVEAVRIDPATGRRIPEAVGGDAAPELDTAKRPGRVEYFVTGTAPEEEATPEGEVDPRFFLLEE
ncbi:MAG: PBP1A family penicillin-binding protein [Myxococcales bacterium]|jgi:penicillin-binding protein 1A|nr:PBP1A family penicillin-binding protein [Myxococcales bacterium]